MSGNLATVLTTLAAAAGDPPAGGAQLGEVVIATAIGLGGTAAILGPALLYRAGKLPALGRLADFAGRVAGLPGWAALPLALLGGALIVAVFGMYWDISLHIDQGRDAGPLANPAHYFILFGLLGVFGAGALGMALPTKPSRSSVHIAGPGWDAPVGAILIAACGAFSLLAFPLDDVWHRIFGQDVTLWSPTHLMLITGASLSVLGAFALHREALEDQPTDDPKTTGRGRLLLIPLGGALLIGLNTYVAEFDFAVPQFRLENHPIGLMLASGLALVTVRLVVGAGGAIGSVAFFLVIRGALTIIVGPILGETMPHFALYVVEALCVEGAALAFTRRGRTASDRPVVFGAVCGALIGTIGLAAEWGWSHLWMVNPWSASLFPEGAILGFLMAVAAGTIGGFVGRALTLGETKLAPAPYWALPVAGVLAIGVVLAALPISAGDGNTSAQLKLDEVTPAPQRTVNATITMQPADAAEGAHWFTLTSWQGGDKSIVASPEEVAPGVYRSTQPVPVSGEWKTILRLHRDDEVLGLPVFMPADSAIPAPEVPAEPVIDRAFQLDKLNLQREQKDDVPGWLTSVSYIAVLLLTVLLIASLVWGLRRIRIRLGTPPSPGQPQAAPGLREPHPAT